MTIEALLSINAPVMFYVTANANLSLKNLVRAKKEAAGMYDTASQDINNDGVVNAKDLTIIRKKILGLV